MLELKNEAIKRMRIMGIADDFIRDYEVNGSISIFERQNAVLNAVRYELENYSIESLKAEIKAFEEGTKAMVYMVQKTWTEFGVLYAFFYVADNDKEYWEEDKKELANGIAFVYVYNESEYYLSEYGEIGFTSSMGGIVRIS